MGQRQQDSSPPPDLSAIDRKMQEILNKGTKAPPSFHPLPPKPSPKASQIDYVKAGSEKTAGRTLSETHRSLIQTEATKLIEALDSMLPELTALYAKARKRCKFHQPLIHRLGAILAEAAFLSYEGASGLMDLDEKYVEHMKKSADVMPAEADLETSVHHPLNITKHQVWVAMGAYGAYGSQTPVSPEVRVKDIWFSLWLMDWLVPRRKKSQADIIRHGSDAYGMAPVFESPYMWATVFAVLPYLKYTPTLDLHMRMLGPAEQEWAGNEVSNLCKMAFSATIGDTFWMVDSKAPSTTWETVKIYSRKVLSGMDKQMIQAGIGPK